MYLQNISTFKKRNKKLILTNVFTFFVFFVNLCVFFVNQFTKYKEMNVLEILSGLPDYWHREYIIDGEKARLNISRDEIENGVEYFISWDNGPRDCIQFVYIPSNDTYENINRFGAYKEEVLGYIEHEANLATYKWDGNEGYVSRDEWIPHGPASFVIDDIIHICWYDDGKLHGRYIKKKDGKIIYKAVYKKGSKKRQYVPRK
jgi:hypothetical protein